MAIRLLFSIHVCWLPDQRACTISPKADRYHVAPTPLTCHSFMGCCDTIGICVYLFEDWVTGHFATMNGLFCLVYKMRKIIALKHFYLLRRKKISCKDAHRCGCQLSVHWILESFAKISWILIFFLEGWWGHSFWEEFISEIRDFVIWKKSKIGHLCINSGLFKSWCAPGGGGALL